MDELFPQFLKIFYPKSNCSSRLGNKTIISCLIGKIGWGDVPGICCPTIPQVFSPAVGEYFRLFPFKAWNNCIFIIVWKKKSTSLLFQSHSEPWTLSCHWNVILLSKHFFQGSPGGNIGTSFSQFSPSMYSPNLSGYSPNVSGYSPQLAGYGPNLSGHALNLSGYSSNLSGYSPNLSTYSPNMSGYNPNISSFSPGTVYTPSPNVSGFSPYVTGYSPNLSGFPSGSPGMTQTGMADTSGLRSRHTLSQTMKNAAGMLSSVYLLFWITFTLLRSWTDWSILLVC